MSKLEPSNTHLRGGSLCLDFANTVDWSDQDEPLAPDTDVLRNPEELTRWAGRLGILESRAPQIDEEELRATHELRRAIYPLSPPTTGVKTLLSTPCSESPRPTPPLPAPADYAPAGTPGGLSGPLLIHAACASPLSSTPSRSWVTPSGSAAFVAAPVASADGCFSTRADDGAGAR